MLPTLWIGDHLFVNKLAYGVAHAVHAIRAARAARAGARRRGGVPARARRATPSIPPDLRPDLPHEDFVKRIIGLPGETDRHRTTGVVFVNGEADPAASAPARPFATRRAASRRDRGDARRVPASRCSTTRASRDRDPGAARSRPGRYFMLGDNRDCSNDSREWGTRAARGVEGPAVPALLVLGLLGQLALAR